MIAVGVAAALLPHLQSERRSCDFDGLSSERRRAVEAHAMTLYRAAVMDTPGDPFAGGPAALAVESDGGHRGPRRRDRRPRARTPDPGRSIRRRGGRRPARRPAAARPGRHPRALPADPGDRRAGHAAARLAGRVRAARGVPGWPTTRTPRPSPAEFLTALAQAGTTTALVFGSHFASAMDIFFAAAERSGLRITAGQVLSDRILPRRPAHHPGRSRWPRARKLIERWHGDGRLRYAVTPRFSLSASEAMLDVCAELLGPSRTSGSPRTSTRTPSRSPGWSSCSPAPSTTSTATTTTGWSPRGASSPTTCTPATSSWSCWPRPGRGSRTARPATPPWAAGCSRCAGTSSTASRVALGSDVGGGTGLLDVQGGAAGLLHAAAARAGRAAAHAGASALSVHPGRRPGARAGREGRGPAGRQGVRRALAAPGGRQHPGRRAAARLRRTRRPGQDLRAGDPGRRRPRSGSAATGFADLRRLPVCDARCETEGRPAISASRTGRGS